VPGTSTINVDVLFRSRNAAEMANYIGQMLARSVKQWRGDLKTEMGKAIQAATKFAFASGETGTAIKSFVKANLAGPYAEAQKALRENDLIAAQKYNDILMKRSRRYKRELDNMTRAHAAVLARQDRSFTQRTDEFKGILGALRGGPEGLLGLFRGGAGRLEQRGLVRQQKGGALAEEAEKIEDPAKRAAQAKAAARMATMGKAIAKVGMALGAIAAVAGVILVIVKAFMDLDKVIKDMNKSLVETAGAADFGFDRAEAGAGAFKKELEKIRRETTGLNQNWDDFAAKTAEQQAVLRALNEAGLTFAMMRDNMKQVNTYMRNYTDAAGLVLTYARAIGMESTQMAQAMGQLVLRGTIDIQQVGEQFSTITREAERAGFQTKRFFSAVVEASSGMAFYGLRIEETTKLLSTMGSMIGQVYSEDVFRKIQGKFKGSFQDMLKTVLLVGEERVTDLYQQAFETRIAQLERQTGISDLRQMVESAGSLEEFQQRILGIEGLQGKDITELMQLGRLRLATMRGNVGAQATQMGAAGPAFQTIMALTATEPFRAFGDNIGEAFNAAIQDEEMGPGIIAALEHLHDLTGEDGPKLIELASTSSGQVKYLQTIAKQGGEIPQWAKDLGVTIENQGTEEAKIMKDGVQILGWEDLFRAQVESRIDQQKAMMSEREIAKAMWEETKSLHDTVSQAILGILTDIYAVVGAILDVMTWGKSEEEKEKLRQQWQTKAAQRELDLREKAQKQAETRAEEARKTQRAATDPREKERARLQEAMAKEEAARAEAEGERAELAKGLLAQRVEPGVEERVGAFRAMQAQLPAGRQLPGGMAKTLQQQLGGISEEDLDQWIERYEETMDKTWGLAGADRAASAVKNMEQYLRATGEWEVLAKQVGGEGVMMRAIEEATKLTEQQIGATTTAWGVQREAGTQLQRYLGAFAQTGVGPESQLTTGERLRGYVGRLAEGQGPESLAVKAESAITLFTKILEQIEKNTNQTAEGVEAGIVIEGAKNVQDTLILPEGGPPLVADAADTVFAAKPGGAIAAALGGGRGGAVTVNIYGGDQSKVYDTVMRVLKATGNA